MFLIDKSFINNYRFYNLLSVSKKIIFDFFIKNNFNFIDFNEIDSVDNCFNFLLLKDNHPSRSLRETFYVDNKNIMRTHTTNFQSLAIQKFCNLKNKKDIGFFTFGKTYRRDNDYTHLPVFNQVDFIFFSKTNSVKKMYKFLIDFLSFFFKKKVYCKLRLSYFPFTSPSFELDLKCFCSNKLCKICQNGWLEIAGCGITNNNILNKFKNFNNSYIVSAMGGGIERLIMIKYKINSIIDIKNIFLSYDKYDNIKKK